MSDSKNYGIFAFEMKSNFSDEHEKHDQNHC